MLYGLVWCFVEKRGVDSANKTIFGASRTVIPHISGDDQHDGYLGNAAYV